MLPGGYRAARPTPKGEGAGEAFFIGGFMVTQKRLKEVLEYDPNTGIFTWKTSVEWKNKRSGTVAGSFDGDGYCAITIDKRKYFAHRLAWLYEYGSFPKGLIDHIDHNKTNNRICNLRDVGLEGNQQNRICASRNSRTGILGVTLCDSGKFLARIRINGKQITLGRFRTANDAHAAYISAKRQFHSTNTL